MRGIEDLYLLYKDDIYRYLLSLTHNPSLSEDLLSETFVNAISSISSFKGKSSIKTWLFSIARNLWLQSLRKKNLAIEYNDLLENYIDFSLEEGILQREIIHRVKALLKEKDERSQKIFKMRVEGYSFAEIGERLGLSENSARVIDFRLKKWIKSVLEEEGLS